MSADAAHRKKIKFISFSFCVIVTLLMLMSMIINQSGQVTLNVEAGAPISAQNRISHVTLYDDSDHLIKKFSFDVDGSVDDSSANISYNKIIDTIGVAVLVNTAFLPQNADATDYVNCIMTLKCPNGTTFTYDTFILSAQTNVSGKWIFNFTFENIDQQINQYGNYYLTVKFYIKYGVIY